MILPARRWFTAAALLALLPLAAFRWPDALAMLAALNLLWVLAFAMDAWRVTRTPIARLLPAREAPPAFSVGRPLPVVYRWPDPGPRPVTLRVREAMPDLLRAADGEDRMLRLEPGQVTRDPLTVEPVRRGKAEAGVLHVRELGPWGLAWRQGRLHLPWSITVFPPLTGVALRPLLTPAERRRLAGLRATRRLGEGRAFESLREWVSGDDTRTIDWKATARRGKLIARQYEDERRQQVMLLLDAGRMLTAETDGRARLEDAIGAVLHLAVAAVNHDDDVGLLVFSDRVERYVAPARGRRALNAIMDALAGVEGRLVEPDYPAAFAFLATRSRKRAFTVVVTDVIDRTASDALIAHTVSLRPRHLPLAVTLRMPALETLSAARPEHVDAAFRRAAAEELLVARAETLADMRRRGVLVLDVPPGEAGPTVVRLYERLKRTGKV